MDLTPPPQEVARHFAVDVRADLGGRINRHWHVQRRGEDLVLRRWAASREDIAWERAVRARVNALGWPAPPDVSDVLACDGALWSLAPLLPGQPWPERNTPAELRQRGRLLAEFHLAVRDLTLPQRPGWRRAEEILNDPALDLAFVNHPDADGSRLLLWHLRRARELSADLALSERPTQLLHGDFTQWNLLFQGSRLSGLLDFELSHVNHRVADFALAWRGAYDDLIHAYHEVSPLDDAEWRMLTPVWWAHLLHGAFQDARRGVQDDGWTARMLRRRSALMKGIASP